MAWYEEKDFVFNFETRGKKTTLTAPVRIPPDQTVSEFASRLMNTHNLPCFIEDDLKENLQRFVDSETEKLQDKNAQEAVERVRSGDVDVNSLVDSWTKAFTEEVLDYAKPEPVSNEKVFSDVYHALIHSPSLETLLNLEHTYAVAVQQLIEQRDIDLANLDKRQTDEMENAVQKLGIAYTSEQINQLAQRHFENTQMCESKWASELSSLQDSQKREYRQWVMTVHEDSHTSARNPTFIQRFRAFSASMTQEDREVEQNTPVRREESFTVHLGAQLKTTHNLRLISADVLEFCRHKATKMRGFAMPEPQRLQTAMSLYSNNLCGLVLLVDNRLNSYTGMKREFAKVCEQSTDFHFPVLEQQFERIEQDVVKGNERRTQHDGDKISLKSSGSSSSAERDNKNVRMQQGDFYITRHSNLSEVHVVFHLVTDDNVRSNDISSRHAVILGYRNILKACIRYDIHTITLPLLLVHEMSEEMTIPWCLKRAELLFKCVKGFMMEIATLSGQESMTIQFLVPAALSDETFASLSSMLPSIFRMSNPVMAKS